MASTSKRNTFSPATSVNPSLLADLYAALNRLVLGIPVILRPNYKINMKTVCEEAGRDRSSIKSHKGFDDIRASIQKCALKRQNSNGSKKVDLDRIQQLKECIRALRETSSAQDEKLAQASQTLYRLYVQLDRMEEDREYLIAKVQSARATSQAVEKAFQVIGFDKFVTQTRDNH